MLKDNDMIMNYSVVLEVNICCEMCFADTKGTQGWIYDGVSESGFSRVFWSAQT